MYFYFYIWYEIHGIHPLLFVINCLSGKEKCCIFAHLYITVDPWTTWIWTTLVTYTWIFFNKHIGKNFLICDTLKKHFLSSRLVYCKNVLYSTHNIPNMCSLLLIRLPVNSTLWVVRLWRSPELYKDFWLHGVWHPNPLVQGSIVFPVLLITSCRFKVLYHFFSAWKIAFTPLVMQAY